MKDTGLIESKNKKAILLSPETAYVVKCQCTSGCKPCFYMAKGMWSQSIEDALIYRHFDLAIYAAFTARREAIERKNCLGQPGSTFDAVPLSGYL
jgi:hypothetical protein